jgi:hypothetical protein
LITVLPRRATRRDLAASASLPEKDVQHGSSVRAISGLRLRCWSPLLRDLAGAHRRMVTRERRLDGRMRG